jgi:hypothetical protein
MSLISWSSLHLPPENAAKFQRMYDVPSFDATAQRLLLALGMLKNGSGLLTIIGGRERLLCPEARWI